METLLLRIGLGNALAAAGLAVVAAVAARLSRRPALAHGLWLLVMLKLVTPPLATFDVAWPKGPDPVVAAPAPTPPVVFEGMPPGPAILPDLGFENPEPRSLAGPIGEPIELPIAAAAIPIVEPAPKPQIGLVDRLRELPIPAWTTIAAAFWLAGSAGWIVLAAARLIRFHRRLRDAKDAPKDVQSRSDFLAARLGLRRSPSVAMLPGAISPLLWAIGPKPRLIVPLELWSRLGEDQRDALLIHELAHLRRGDHRVRLLELVVGALYWWLPVAWWARRALREAEEECCDAWVVWALPESNRSYAIALLEAVEFLSEPRAAFPLPLGASGMGQFRHLSRRIAMIMKGSTPRRLSWVGLLGMIALAALLLPWLPSLSARQEPKPGPLPTTAPIVEAAEIAELPFAAAGSPRWPYTVEESPISLPIADPAKLEEARDEVELLEATEKAKKAAVDAAAGEVGIQEGKVKRVEPLVTKGAVDIATLHEARAAHQNAVSQLAIRQAELNEAAIRLRQAKRRLERLEKEGRIARQALPAPPPPPGFMGPGGLPIPGPSGGAIPIMPARPVAPMPTAKPGHSEGIPTMPGAGPGAGMMPGGMAGMMGMPGRPAVMSADALDIERLKKIGTAMHNYVDVNNTFPAAVMMGKDGKPLLSWRVRLLPFLGDPAATRLWEQFRLDEPWDSDHNKTLIGKMPEVYARANIPADVSSGLTPDLVFLGPGAIFESDGGAMIASITDGTSNTLLVVQGSDRIPWTKPESLAFDSARRHPGDPANGPDIAALKREIDPEDGGFLALFADGAVRRIPGGIPDSTLRALITRNGGEVTSNNFLIPAGPPVDMSGGGGPGPDVHPPGFPQAGMMMGGMGPGMATTTPPRPSGKAARSPRSTQPSDSDRRLAELEKKMERLFQEMEAIRKERGPTTSGEPIDLVPAIPAPKSGEPIDLVPAIPTPKP